MLMHPIWINRSAFVAKMVGAFCTCLGLVMPRLRCSLTNSPLWMHVHGPCSSLSCWLQLQLEQLVYMHSHGNLSCRAKLTALQLLLAVAPTVAQARQRVYRPAPAAALETGPVNASWLWCASAEAEATADELFALLAGAAGPWPLQVAAWCASMSLIWLTAVALESGGSTA